MRRIRIVASLLSGGLQLIVMPWVMPRVDPVVLLKTIPLLAGVGFAVAFVSPGFQTVTGAFATIKILDYSIR